MRISTAITTTFAVFISILASAAIANPNHPDHNSMRPASFVINVDIADMNIISGIGPVDPTNSTAMLAFLEQYSEGTYGVTWTIDHTAVTNGIAHEDVSPKCLKDCLFVLWWGPLVYAV